MEDDFTSATVVLGPVAYSPGVRQAVTPRQSFVEVAALADAVSTVVGLVARTIAECIPSATAWVGVTSMSVKPTA